MDDGTAASWLNQAMDDARIELGVKWEDIAQRAGVGTSTLHRFRKGEGPRTAETTRRVEKALGWPRGYIDALVEGRELPESLPRDEHTELLAEIDTKLAELRELSHRVAELGHKRETG